MKAVTAEQMQEIERRSVEAGVSLDTLMENAGLAVANEVAARFDRVYGSIVTVLVGQGNNGSDGLVAARHLARRGAKVRAFALTTRPENDEKRELAEAAGVNFVLESDADALGSAAASSDVVIDAILGTGKARPIEEPLAGKLEAVRKAARFVVAIDLPTGMDADTGAFDENGLRADLTLMLGYPKFGPLVTVADGYCGEIRVLDIGISTGLADDVSAESITPEFALTLLRHRPDGANKGSFGHTLIVGGSRNYLGAPLLAARAAVRSGAGLVYVAAPEPVYNLIAGQVQEAIYLPLSVSPDGDLDVPAATHEALNAAGRMSSILIGPGLGQSPATVQFVERLVRGLGSIPPVVLDADALNIVSRMPGWPDLLETHAVLTPHPGEMARLLKTDVPDVQKDRVGAIRKAVNQFNATVVLKGAGTLVATTADPEPRIRISPWVNSGLAKGGTGDVLAGLLAGLMAQPLNGTSYAAASLAVYLHGLAGDIARENIGEHGMTAGDVADAIPAAFRSIEG